MNNHIGRAILALSDDGSLLDATTDLSKDDSGTWGGTLCFPANERTGRLLNLTEGSLEINGRAGKFIRPDTSDWLDSAAGEFQIRIVGNGDAPF